MDETMAKIYTLQVARGLEHLHCIKNIIHRDIKPANLLIAGSGNVKISDFGEAKYLKEVGSTIRGTPLYMAPEILDVSFGAAASNIEHEAVRLLCGHLVSGVCVLRNDDQQPVHSSARSDSDHVGERVNRREIIQRIKDLTQDKINLRINSSRLSQTAKNFLKSCLHLDPSQRSNIYELLNSK